jgi:hypothetical protein
MTNRLTVAFSELSSPNVNHIQLDSHDRVIYIELRFDAHHNKPD